MYRCSLLLFFFFWQNLKVCPPSSSFVLTHHVFCWWSSWQEQSTNVTHVTTDTLTQHFNATSCSPWTLPVSFYFAVSVVSLTFYLSLYLPLNECVRLANSQDQILILYIWEKYGLRHYWANIRVLLSTLWSIRILSCVLSPRGMVWLNVWTLLLVTPHWSWLKWKRPRREKRQAVGDVSLSAVISIAKGLGGRNPMWMQRGALNVFRPWRS